MSGTAPAPDTVVLIHGLPDEAPQLGGVWVPPTRARATASSRRR
jgi:hypothetical protein